MRFSANLGFLFTDRPLVEAVAAAGRAGFDAVECHWPFEVPPAELKAACAAAGVPLLALNTWAGDRSKGMFGYAALPDHAETARAEIDRAVDYAAASGAGAVHVMAGVGGTDAAFVASLDYACGKAEAKGLTILIEPLNTKDAPGYHLTSTAHALRLIDEVGRPNLKVMFDCYHLEIMEGDLLHLYRSMKDHVGHIQFAAVPDRGEPDRGTPDYPRLLPALRDAGYDGFFGAEYRPRSGRTEDGLGWMADYEGV